MSLSYTKTFLSGSIMHNLEGDKLILPPSVLLDLLQTANQSNPDDFSNSQLPQPIIFQISNPKTRLITHGGVLEFNAEDEKVYLPPWMYESLSLKEGSEVTIRLKELPKGTWVRFRPMNTDYKEIRDYRAAFEGYLRSHYATLTEGEILTIKQANSSYQFLVEELKPANAVQVLDTDLEVEITPFSDPNSQNVISTIIKPKENDIRVGEIVKGIVNKDEYVYWKATSFERSHGLNIELNIKTGDADLLVSTNRNPKVDEHIWSDFSSDPTKSIFIESTNSEYASNSEIYIGVFGFSDSPTSYELNLMSSDHPLKSVETTLENFDTNENSPGNNVLCKVCGKVIKKDEKERHWHCDQCEKNGDIRERDKHMHVVHTNRQCSCGYETQSLPEMASHKQTTCPDKLIVCRFCHNYVKSGGFLTNQQDLLDGLTAHESYCGGRTITCTKCGLPVILKNVKVHHMMHEMERQNRRLPRLCRNKNCIRSAADNALRLCVVCFGPFWSPSADPNKKMLYTRVARKYHSQLTTGCGQKWCKNEYCATGNSTSQDPTTAALTLAPLLKQLQSSATAPMYLCVDETTTRKRLLANILYKSEDIEGIEEYPDEFCVKAIEVEDEDIVRARNWLRENAPNKSIKS
ncbi:11922_t:CDS:2 [Acaulospora morrowiae]|uniref:11922_t:CDS:1 n=1 Tax=Acaulospora morrowiae TaxID=94023 RepID=A0A9N9E2R1_9GLOM|nr:11922_t:CDS:2 [Acaulospora morrowiae]